jgi:hypothetical protein
MGLNRGHPGACEVISRFSVPYVADTFRIADIQDIDKATRVFCVSPTHTPSTPAPATNGGLFPSVFSKVVSNGPYPIPRQWQVRLTPDLRCVVPSTQNRKNFGCGHAARHCVDGRVSDHTARVDDENRRFRNAASLSCIQQVPFSNDVALAVAQDGKWQGELRAQSFGFRGRIDGNGGYACACRPNLSVMIAIVRQLAVAKRSPPAAIEQQHQRPVRCQIRKTLPRSCRIPQAKIGRRFA